jgi:hypothetical protein
MDLQYSLVLGGVLAIGLIWLRYDLIPILCSHAAFRDCFVALLLAMTPNFVVIASEAMQSHATLSSRTGIRALTALTKTATVGAE